MEAYFYTMRNLLNHYMLKKLKLDQGEINTRINNLKDFVDENIESLDDYLNKIELFAHLIQEPESKVLANYIGKQFLPSLESIQKKIIQREVPKYQELHEDPLRTVSHDLLILVQSGFEKAATLIWPPPPKPKQETENDKTSEKKEDNSERPAAIPQESAPKTSDTSQKNESLQTQQEAENSQEAPGVALLNELTQEFINAEPLKLPLKLEQPPPNSNAGNNAPESPRQITFKEFTQVMSRISKFSREQDIKSYNAWTASLQPSLKALVSFNRLLSQESKGEKIEWKQQTSLIANYLNLEPKIIERLKYDFLLYRGVLTDFYRIIQASPPAVRGSYQQLISLLSKEEPPEVKKNSLKIALLQFEEENVKLKLEKELGTLIDRLG